MTSAKTPAAPAAVEGKNVVGNGLMLVGDMMFPGTSLLLGGRVKEGVTHSLLGWAGRAVLGPVGWAVIAANSYSKATTNKNLTAHLFGRSDARSSD
jgi:hypothetical protein